MVDKAFIPVVPTASPRLTAAQALLKRERGGGFIENLLDEAVEASRLSPVDRSLCRELGLGCVRWQSTLDWLIGRRTGGREQKVQLRVVLRLGLYQLLWLDRIPAHAAVHESVELSRELGCGPQSGFVNALLRGYTRELKETRALLNELKADQPALGYSHPEWLYKRWEERWGQEAAARLADWNNSPAETFARLNSIKTDAGKLLERWRMEGVEYDFVSRSWLPDNQVFRLKTHPPLAKLGSFRDGFFYVQDPSTLLAPLLLDPQLGESVLDLCAAPGGKTTFMAQLMKDEGNIVACDPSEKRLKMVSENCARLGIFSVRLSSSGAAGRSSFDRVLVDAPCSNTGVMRRRVDLRWRIKPEEIHRLSTTQLELLRTAAQLVKVDGCIVYSTCSLEEEENNTLVRQFLSENSGFELEDEQLVGPASDTVDGAYAASLKRKA